MIYTVAPSVIFQLPLLFLENETAQVAVKTSGGISNRVPIHNIIMQGSVWGSICCVVLMDKLGQLAYNDPNLLYHYKDLVATPPLQMVDDVLGVQKCSKKSQRLNSMINTFMELEKLTLSEKKCHNVHVGKNRNKCPDLKVHDSVMKNTKQETYLGDKIDQSGMLKPTIQSRVSKGYGAITSILAIINEIPLGHWRVEAGLKLREAMFLNGILFNSEAWQGITDDEVEMLEKVDEALLRGILNGHSKLPLEALFLETGSIRIRDILKSRRLCYLKTILQRDDEELVKEIYNAQKTDPIDGDFVILVDKDSKDISLGMAEDSIITTKDDKYKNIVKTKVKTAAFKSLLDVKTSHSKMDELTYEKLQLSQYLKSPLFNSESMQMLLALRTRTVRGIKNDFRGMYPDVGCPLGCTETDTLSHVLSFTVLQANMDSTSLATSTVQYRDIFSTDIVKQKQVTEAYIQLLKIREEMVNSMSVTNTDPVHLACNSA